MKQENFGDQADTWVDTKLTPLAKVQRVLDDSGQVTRLNVRELGGTIRELDPSTTTVYQQMKPKLDHGDKLHQDSKGSPATLTRLVYSTESAQKRYDELVGNTTEVRADHPTVKTITTGLDMNQKGFAGFLVESLQLTEL